MLRRMMGRWLCGLALSLCLLPVSAARAQTPDASPHEPALRLIQQAVTPQRDGSHLALLLALRQLRDPALMPLFERLLSHDDWRMQTHAALALAELDSQQRIDPAVLAKLGPVAQESVIATALDLKFIKPDQVPRLLSFENLHPIARVLLMADLFGHDRSKVDVDSLMRLADSEDHLIAGLSAALLAQLNRPEKFAAYQQRLAGLDNRERQSVSSWLLDAVRRYKLDAVREWGQFVIDHPETSEALQTKAVFTQLSLGGEEGIDAWRHYAQRDSNYNHRVRSLLMLLASRAHAPADALETLRDADRDPLIDGLVDAASAISQQRDPNDALIALLKLNHPKTNDWVMEYCADLPNSQAARMYGFMLERVSDSDFARQPRQTELIVLASQSARELFQLDPDALESQLRRAEDDSVLQEAILLGLLETNSPRASVAAAMLPRIGAGRADSLALLLASRQLPPKTDDDKMRLRTIAAGGARVSDSLRAQAAWLSLKHAGQAEAAIRTALASP